MIPIYRRGRRGKFTIRAGMLLYDLLSRKKSLPGHRMLDAAAAQEKLPGLNAEGLRGAAIYHDAQVTFHEERGRAACCHGRSLRHRQNHSGRFWLLRSKGKPRNHGKNHHKQEDAFNAMQYEREPIAAVVPRGKSPG